MKSVSVAGAKTKHDQCDQIYFTLSYMSMNVIDVSNFYRLSLNTVSGVK